MPYIGQPVPRREDARFITGAGRYTDDVHLAGETYAYILRSPYPHASIGRIATAAAAAAPGVLAVLTAADYIADGHLPLVHAPNPADAIDPSVPAFVRDPEGSPIRIARPYPLAGERARYTGEAVAMVIAESAAAARDAAELVEIAYEQQMAVAVALDGLDPQAPQLWDDIPENLVLDVAFGATDIEAARAIAGSPTSSIESEFVNQRIVAAQLEPRSLDRQLRAGQPATR